MTRHSPTVRQRRLAHELKRLRTASGLSLAQVAQRLEWSVARLSRIETATMRPHWGDVADLTTVYGVTGVERDNLIQLARQARERSWWSRYSDVLSSAYVGLEAETSELRVWEPRVVPDLLQTAEYTRSVIRASRMGAQEGELTRHVEAQARRQELLDRDSFPLTLHAVIDESVLRRRVGGTKVMREQLRHLVEAAGRPNVTLRVLPFGAGEHAGLPGGFAVLTFSDPRDPEVVYGTGTAGEHFLEQVDEVAQHRRRFDAITASALPPRESTEFITRLEGGEFQ